MTETSTFANVRYVVDDVQAAIDFDTTHLGFTLLSNPARALADVAQWPLRLRSQDPGVPVPVLPQQDAAMAGRNRIQVLVADLDAEIGRLQSAGVPFRSELTAEPVGGRSWSRTPQEASSSSSSRLHPTGENFVNRGAPDDRWPEHTACDGFDSLSGREGAGVAGQSAAGRSSVLV